MENFIASQATNMATNILNEEKEADGKEGNSESGKSASKRNKMLILVLLAVLFCIQFFREIFANESIMQQLFYLANNYVNTTRVHECSRMQKVNE